MHSHLRPGDVIVVFKLDRLGRSLKHLIELINDLDKRDVGLKRLSFNLNNRDVQNIVMSSLEANNERSKKGLFEAVAT